MELNGTAGEAAEESTYALGNPIVKELSQKTNSYDKQTSWLSHRLFAKY